MDTGDAAELDRRWSRLRHAAGFLAREHTRSAAVFDDGIARAPWPHDAMRHTIASMHHAMHQKESEPKAQMGHSKDEDTLMQHYRELCTRKQAEALWALRPSQFSAPAIEARCQRHAP